MFLKFYDIVLIEVLYGIFFMEKNNMQCHMAITVNCNKKASKIHIHLT